MAKCEACGGRIAETFLNKLVGTVVKDAKGKQHSFCASCQRSQAKAELLAALK